VTPADATPPAHTTAPKAELAATGVSGWTPLALGAGFASLLLGAGLVLVRRIRRA
jgi:LPXTG-motif cell wall-anchored protein